MKITEELKAKLENAATDEEAKKILEGTKKDVKDVPLLF